MARIAPASHIAFSQKVVLFLAASTLYLQIGCASHAMNSDLQNPIGIAEMSKDGVLTIRMFNTPAGNKIEVVRPSDFDYDAMRQRVGGINPGEKKSIYETIGTVYMDKDGVITYALHGIEKEGPQFLKSGKSKPGDADYDSWLSAVGGLKPGETKAVPAW